jgi:hypothetical protein
VRMSLYDRGACARFCCMERAKPRGSVTATDFSSARAMRSCLLFSRCSCNSDMADRSAMASGFSLSDIATEGGCCLKVATGGGFGRGASVRSTGASWAIEALGVMGDTGGRFGEALSDRFRERSDVDEASLDEVGRASVSTRSAGMTARWATPPGAAPEESSQNTDRRCQVACGPEGGNDVNVREHG